MFLRRTSESGRVNVLGRTFDVDPLWQHRLVRCEVNLNAEVIRFHALRRRHPSYQPLLKESRYALPKRPFPE